MAHLLKRAPLCSLLFEPISQLVSIFRNMSTVVPSMIKQVQLLPVIQPCELHPNGKIQLYKWRKGNYAERYTGLIETIPQEPEINRDESDGANEAEGRLRPALLKTAAKDLIPSNLLKHLTHLDLCAVLQFDGPPDSEEFVFISYLKCHKLEHVNGDNLPYFAEWFDLDKIPYSQMPADDFHWYPKVLNGKKVRGEFIFGGITELTIKSFSLEEVSDL